MPSRLTEAYEFVSHGNYESYSIEAAVKGLLRWEWACAEQYLKCEFDCAVIVHILLFYSGGCGG